MHVDFFGDCDDCYIYLNGVKVTKEMAASQKFTTKDQTKITIVPVGMFHDSDVVDVIVENAYNSSTGEHVTLEDTHNYLFGAVYGETIRLNVEIPEDWTAYTFTIEITVTYSNIAADDKVIKTYYIHSDDLDGDYYDLVIEYPGYYEIDVSAGKVVN